MATFGEIKWASLLSDRATLVGKGFLENSLNLHFASDGKIIRRENWVEISKFSLYDIFIVVSHGEKLKCYMNFLHPTRYSSLTTLRFIWIPKRIVRKNDDLLIYSRDSPAHLVIPFKGDKKLIFLATSYARRVKLVPRRTPSQIMSLILTQSDPSYKRETSYKLVRGSFRSFFDGTKRPSPQKTDYTLNQDSFNSAGTYTVGQTYNGINRYYRSYTGTITPNFRNVDKSKLPINSYSLLIYRKEEAQGFITKYSQSNFKGTWDTSLAVPEGTIWSSNNVHYPSGHNPAATNKALSRLADVANTGLSANLAQDIAQFGQLSKLIVTTSNRLRNSVYFLKRKRFSLAVDALVSGLPRRELYKNHNFLSASKTLAQNWLELQYAWKPLLHDVDVVMRLTNEYFKDQTPIQVVKASATVRSRSQEGIPSQNFSTAGFPVSPIQAYHDSWSTCRIGARFTVQDKLKNYLAQTGFTTPVNLLWEIIPFSFVYDWFHPIGPYLESFSNWHGLKFIDGFQTNFTRSESFVRCEASGNYNQQFGYQSVKARGSIDVTRIEHNRVKLTNFPEMRFPSPKNPISAEHALNAIALLRVVFSKGSPPFRYK